MSYEQKINHNWLFAIDSTAYSSPSEINELDWKSVNIPHTAQIEPLIVNNQWQGTCWYKKVLDYSPSWKNKELFIRFEGAMNVAEVWINQTKKITHYGGYLPFVINITHDIKPGQENTLYLRLNNEDNEVTGPKSLIDLDFNMYGGIYRDVYLKVKTPVHITDEQYANQAAGGGIFVTYPKVTEREAAVNVKTHVFNASDKDTEVQITQELFNDQEVIASATITRQVKALNDIHPEQILNVENPDLWSPQNPALYSLVTTLSTKNSILDKQTTRIGIRKFEFKENKLFLNDQEVFLRGVNRHQEYPYIGYALSNAANYRDAYKIKQAGFDYVRLSHYPHSKAFMDACDELGIITIDAILGWQYYREYEPFREHVLQTCRDMIRRDRNHPSVLAWEVSLNESWMPEEFIDSLVAVAQQEYPVQNCYTAGWQRYGFDIFLQARQHRLGHAENPLPDKPYLVSEYGDWEYYAMNAGLDQGAWSDLLPEERSSRQLLGSSEKNLLQQALNVQEAHNSNYYTPAIGDGYWVMFDYNRGYADDLEASGLMSIFRMPKFAYYFYQSQRSPGEQIFGEENPSMVFIASYNTENSSENIRVFSNSEQVELIQNGMSLGKQSPDQNSISSKLEHPPFTFKKIEHVPGTLTAIAFVQGKEVARHMLSTPDAPAKLKLQADLSGYNWQSGCNDAIFIRAAVLDMHGKQVNTYNGKVDFSITGDARIIGSSSPAAEAGVSSLLLMAGQHPDEIRIIARIGEQVSGELLISTSSCK